MKLSEIIKKIDEGMQIYKLGIKINKYLNITDKRVIIAGIYSDKDLVELSKKMDGDTKLFNGIVNEVILEVDNYFIVDYFLLDTMFCSEIALNYTNIELDDEGLTLLEEKDETFSDFLYRTELFEYIKGEINENDLDRFEELLALELEQKLKSLNSTTRLVNTIKKELLGMIPSERKIKNMLKKIENFDTSKLKTITDLKDFVTKK